MKTKLPSRNMKTILYLGSFLLPSPHYIINPFSDGRTRTAYSIQDGIAFFSSAQYCII